MRYTLSDILHDSSFIVRVLNRFQFLKNRMYRFLPLDRKLDSKIRRYFAKLSVEDMKKMITESVVGSDVLGYKEADQNFILNVADATLNSEIEILGGKVNLNKVDWATDYKCGYRWENKYYTKYKTTRFGTEEDVKTVWDLSRGHYLLWMAEAYQLSGDEKYAQRVVDLICDWIDNNPYRKSINWTCAMEVAIRAINWMCAVSFILDSHVIDKAFLEKLMKSLFQHGSFIYNNLENGIRYSANHYASDLAGLIWLGSLFSNTPEGRRWYGFAFPACFDEMRTQILPSGVHFERTISYHRLTCEVFMYSIMAIQKRDPGYRLPNDIVYRLQSMVEFVAHYTKPNGFAPLFGDNDNGRLLPFVPRDYRNHTDILNVYNSIFNKSIQPITKSRLFADAGFAILKNKRFYVAFSNTGVSRYSDVYVNATQIGTHTHQDALSFEMAVGNSDFVIDAGTAGYTSSKELRDEFRSTQKHNTLSIEGKSQYGFGQNDYFSIVGQYSEPESIDYISDGNMETVSSSFNWRLADYESVKHERKMTLFDDKLCVEDTVSSTNVHEYEWSFFLSPKVSIEKDDEKGLVLIGEYGECVEFGCEGEKKLLIRIEEDTFSPSYGIIIPTKKIKCKINAGRICVRFTFRVKEN